MHAKASTACIDRLGVCCWLTNRLRSCVLFFFVHLFCVCVLWWILGTRVASKSTISLGPDEGGGCNRHRRSILDTNFRRIQIHISAISVFLSISRMEMNTLGISWTLLSNHCIDRRMLWIAIQPHYTTTITMKTLPAAVHLPLIPHRLNHIQTKLQTQFPFG